MTSAMRDHGQPVAREHEARDLERLLQRLRRRHRDRVAAPDDEADIRNDVGDAERHQHLAQLVAGKPAQDQALEQSAQHRDGESAEECCEPQVRDNDQNAGAQVGTEHVERAVREVRDPQQPEDQRKSRRQQKQQPAERETIERLYEPELHARKKRERLAPPPLTMMVATRDFSRAGSRANRPDSSGTPRACRSRTGSRSDRSEPPC